MADINLSGGCYYVANGKYMAHRGNENDFHHSAKVEFEWNKIWIFWFAYLSSIFICHYIKSSNKSSICVIQTTDNMFRVQIQHLHGSVLYRGLCYTGSCCKGLFSVDHRSMNSQQALIILSNKLWTVYCILKIEHVTSRPLCMILTYHIYI